MDYTPAGKAQESTVVSADHIIDFYLDYLRRDNLGQIANAHLVWADKKPDGVRCAECLQLAALQSSAVDFAKTGVAADFPRRAQPRRITAPDACVRPPAPPAFAVRCCGRRLTLIVCVCACVGSCAETATSGIRRGPTGCARPTGPCTHQHRRAIPACSPSVTRSPPAALP